MADTLFYPIVHGFQFSNNDIRWNYHGLRSGRNLCGGMAFAALDHYYNNVPIPAATAPPAVGTPLHEYIYQRQIEAHYVAFPWLANGASPFGESSFPNCANGDAFTALRQCIDRLQPIPILLADRETPLSTNSHWVVATGYGETNGICTHISLYDNNHPRRTCRIELDITAGVIVHRETQHLYGYYVPVHDFRPRDPSRPIQAQSMAPLFSNPWGLQGP